MDTVLYKAMSGAQMDFYRQSLTANNLANVNTPGFKADLFNAQTMYLTGNTLINDTVVIQQPNNSNFTAGGLMTTGRDLDVAIQGEGWFAVQDEGGKEAYTRAGDFKLTENGVLVTASGRPVLGDGGPISIPPAQRIDIGSDGTISIVPLDADPKALAVLDRIKLAKIDRQDLIKGIDGLMRLEKGGIAPTDPTINVVGGALESSNVNAAEEMVNMITAGREFETQMKIMQSVDENGQRLAQLLQD